MYPLGDTSIVVQFGQNIDLETHRRVQQLAVYLDHHPFFGLIEYVPAFTQLTVFYDSFAIYKQSRTESPFEKVRAYLLRVLDNLEETADWEPTIVEIPVCYGGEFGPDLEEVADYNKLSADKVIEIHARGEYLVYMLGFAPGFPYLGGLSETLSTPRRATPRLAIPAGSVGIAGNQTGIYPIETPGGWQLIGKTPLRLFRPGKNPPTLLRSGQIVKFEPISRLEYDRWKEALL